MNFIEFWELTPSEFFIKCNAFSSKQKVEGDEKIIISYLTAYWQRVNRMPKLADILKTDNKPKVMTPEEMLNQIKQLNTRLQGEEG